MNKHSIYAVKQEQKVQNTLIFNANPLTFLGALPNQLSSYLSRLVTETKGERSSSLHKNICSKCTLSKSILYPGVKCPFFIPARQH